MATKKEKRSRKAEQVIATRHIGNISGCNTLDELKRRFDADVERWEADAGDSEALDSAVGYWLGYPTLYLNVQSLYDGSIEDRIRARLALDRAHHRATEYLMVAAERAGIDSGGLMESAMLCRALLNDSDNLPLCIGKGIWPDCLTPHLKTLAPGQWETAQRGYATLARLSAKLDLSLSKDNTAIPTGEAEEEHATSRMSPRELAEKYGVDAEHLRKRLDRWRYSHDEGYNEVSNARKNEPKYLYDEAAVMPVIRELQRKPVGRKRATNGRRKKI